MGGVKAPLYPLNAQATMDGNSSSQKRPPCLARCAIFTSDPARRRALALRLALWKRNGSSLRFKLGVDGRVLRPGHIGVGNSREAIDGLATRTSRAARDRRIDILGSSSPQKRGRAPSATAFAS